MNNLTKIYNPQKKPNSWIFHVISIVVSLGSIYIITSLIIPNLDELSQILSQVKIWPLLVLIILFGVAELIGAFAWARIMNGLANPLPLKTHLRIFVVTHAARRIPGTIWHVIGRVAWYERFGISKRVTTLANAVETILIIWSAVIVALVFSPFTALQFLPPLWLILPVIAIIILSIHPKLLQFILRLLKLETLQTSLTYKDTLSWLALFVVLWLVTGTLFFLVIISMLPGSWFLWSVSVTAMCLSGIAGSLFLLLPSGFGLGEAISSSILAFHVPPSVAATSAILLRIIITVLEFSLASIFFWGVKNMKRLPKAQK